MKNITLKQNLLLDCLSLRNSILLGIISILLFGCSLKKEDNYSLVTFLSDIDSSKILSDYNTIIYVADGNVCITCTIAFANITQNYLLNKDSVLIILNSDGTRLDISLFKSDTVNNVVFDYKGKFYQLGLFENKNSGIVLLQNNQIDSVIELDVDKLNEQLMFLQK